MADLLSYRPSNSAVYYQPPKRLDIGRTLLGFVIAAALTAAGAFLYAYLLPQLKYITLRAGAAVSAAVAVGVISVMAVRFGKVRIPMVATFIGAILALLALYVMWLTWVHDVLNFAGARVTYTVLFTHPVS